MNPLHFLACASIVLVFIFIGVFAGFVSLYYAVGVIGRYDVRERGDIPDEDSRE